MPHKSIQVFYAALYFVTRCYGGAEEGGWYYDEGELQGKPKAFSSREARDAFIERADRCMDSWHFENARPLSSVASQGRFEVEAYDEPPPKRYPEERPRYE